MIENFTNDEMLFQRALKINPSLTKDEFNKERQASLKPIGDNAKNLINVNGVVMEASETLDPDKAKELKDKR